MTTDHLEQPTSKRPPRWLVAVVVLATAGVTAWAMSMTGLRGPQVSWASAREAVEEVWGEQPGVYASPGPGVVPVGPALGNPVQPVAGFTGTPPIAAGAAAPHVDRGACTICHAVTTPQGMPLASIRSYSTMSHQYRGLCVNCHQGTIAPRAAGSLVAATTAPTPLAVGNSGGAMLQPREAEWQGLEVAPGSSGRVEVASAEAAARVAGVQRGDMVSSVNGYPIFTMTDFVQATQTGRLSHGTLIVSRSGQRLAFELGQPGVGVTSPAAGAVGPSAITPAQPEARF